MEDHAWNVVDIYGQYYHLDVTFNLTMTDAHKRYDYFNLTDIDILKDHKMDDKLPPCMSTKSNYFVLQSSIVDNLSSLENYFVRSINQGEKAMLFKIGFPHDQDKIENSILDLAKNVYYSQTNKSFCIEARSNKIQGVYELKFIE